MAKLPEILNESRSKNYIAGNKVFLLDSLHDSNCAELIGNLSNMVDALDWKPEYKIGTKITNPYQLPADAPVIDVYINSNGGTLIVYKSIMALLNLARAHGAIIRTHVMGLAASCASLVAIQGTPGFRIMSDQSYQLVHYGTAPTTIENAKELERFYEYEKTMRKNLFNPYLKHTNISKQQLKEMQSAEKNYINAHDCLNRYCMCDWILTSDGKFIQRGQKTR